MRVQPTRPSPASRTAAGGRGKVDAGEPARLEAMLRELGARGERLGASLSWEELAGYKELAGRFLREVVGHAFRLREEQGQDRRGQRRIYHLVQEANRKMLELTELCLQDQQDRLAILAKLGEIQGILLDLYR